MTFTAILICTGLFLSLFAAFALWMLIDVNRINRHPEDDYPISRHTRGKWDE